MSADIVRRRLHVKETFATVIAAERYMDLARRTIVAARAEIESYIAGQPRFLTALEPRPVDMGAPPLARRMAAAAMRRTMGGAAMSIGSGSSERAKSGCPAI